MNHFITLKDIPAADLRKIVADEKKRKDKRKKFKTFFSVKNYNANIDYYLYWHSDFFFT